MPPSPVDATRQPSRWWLRGLAVVWLGLFFAWFYSFELPNNAPISRGDIWALLPDLLLENFFSTPSAGSPAPPSGWRYLPQRFDILAVAGFILAGAWGMGALALRMLQLRERFDAPSRTVFVFGLGLSGLSLLTLVSGLAGWLNRWLFVTAIILLIAGELVCRIRDHSRKSAEKGVPWSQRHWQILPVFCVVSVAPFLLAMLLGAMLPSIDFDVKEYHLEGPKEFFRQGQVTFLPHNVYTSFPFLTEMLSLLAMVLRDDWYVGALAGKAVLMMFAPLTALGLFAAGRRWFSPEVGWLCVLFYLTTPWISRISIIAYAEGGLTFYLFATLLAAMWLVDGHLAGPVDRRGESASVRPQDWVLGTLLCGLLAGSAVACKYPGVLSVAIPLGGSLAVAACFVRLPGVDDRRVLPGIVRTVAVFTLGTLITFGPWMAKNIAETGNPVYPLLYTVFGGTDWDADSHRKWQEGHPPAIVKLGDNPRALVNNLFTRGVDVIARSDWQSPLLFAAAPFALLWSGRRRLVIVLWAYIGWLFATWWALTHQIDRFWVPMLPVVTLLAGAGAGWLLGPEDKNADTQQPRLSLGMRGLASLLIAAVVLFNLAFVTSPLCGYNAYLVDLVTARHHPKGPTTPSMRLVQDRLPASAKVLFVGEAQVFDAEHDYVYNTVFDESLFERWTSAADPDLPADEQPLRSVDEIRTTLREHGVTHIFVNWSEILRYRETYGYTEYVSPDRFGQLVRAGILVPMALDPVSALRDWDTVNQFGRITVYEWGDTLHVTAGGHEFLKQYELFEVR